MNDVKCSCCKEPIQGLIYVRMFDHETPYCYECMEKEDKPDDLWESYYFSEYLEQAEESEYLDYGDKKSKEMRDEL